MDFMGWSIMLVAMSGCEVRTDIPAVATIIPTNLRIKYLPLAEDLAPADAIAAIEEGGNRLREDSQTAARGRAVQYKRFPTPSNLQS